VSQDAGAGRTHFAAIWEAIASAVPGSQASSSPRRTSPSRRCRAPNGNVDDPAAGKRFEEATRLIALAARCNACPVAF